MAIFCSRKKIKLVKLLSYITSAKCSTWQLPNYVASWEEATEDMPLKGLHAITVDSICMVPVRSRDQKLLLVVQEDCRISILLYLLLLQLKCICSAQAAIRKVSLILFLIKHWDFSFQHTLLFSIALSCLNQQFKQDSRTLR